MYAWVVVALRYPIVLAWIAALVASLAFLPGLGTSSTAPLSDIVPSDAKAVVAQQRALRLFGSTLATDVAVVQRDPRGLTRAAIEAQLRAAAAASRRGPGPRLPGVLAAVPLVNEPIPGVHWREHDTTALTYLFLSPDLNLLERDRVAHRYAYGLPGPAPGSTRGVTGAGPARLEQFQAIDDVLPWVEAATVLVILVICALFFRSLGAALVTLGTAAIAYVIAIRVLAWSGERAGVAAPSEIEPVLVVLLLGLVTDYTMFFMSETRRRLRRGEHRVAAARRVTARIAPIVFTAGILVAGGAASLLAGHLRFFRVFGPGLAIAAIVVTLVCVTLVPALMALLGPRLFGARARDAQRAPRPHRDDDTAAGDDARPSAPRARWRLWFAGPLGALAASRRHAEAESGRVLPRFFARMMTARPFAALLALVCVGLLVLAATGARSTRLGVSFIPSLPRDSEARRAADAAAAGFVPGVVSPTDVVVEQAGIGRRPAQLAALQRLIARTPGVAAVLGPAQSAGSPLQSAVISRDGGAVRYAVLLSHEPTGPDAIDTVRRLEDHMPALVREAGLAAGARVSYAGDTALAAETVDSIVVDMRRVGLATALVTFVLLALFLRSLVAPLLLLTGTVLALAGSFGLSALLLADGPGGAELIYYVPLVAAVLLVGLGSDYNVFIAGRIREEARRRRLREAIAVAAPSASRAITVAGITLASTFALLAIVPLRPFRELALLMTIGVLIDALIVRPVLVPALIAVAGRFAWWPGGARRRAVPGDFAEEVARRSGRTPAEAGILARATLRTLAERIPEREAREIAALLPPEPATALGGAAARPEAFPYDEFVDRVAGRAGTSRADARAGARAVMATLAEALPAEEVDYLMAALSRDYAALFGDAVEPEPREAPPAPAA
jgi:putative drug exporter of the RND superfamily